MKPVKKTISIKEAMKAHRELMDEIRKKVRCVNETVKPNAK
jgi:hypothetical protein